MQVVQFLAHWLVLLWNVIKGINYVKPQKLNQLDVHVWCKYMTMQLPYIESFNKKKKICLKTLIKWGKTNDSCNYPNYVTSDLIFNLIKNNCLTSRKIGAYRDDGYGYDMGYLLLYLVLCTTRLSIFHLQYRNVRCWFHLNDFKIRHEYIRIICVLEIVFLSQIYLLTHRQEVKRLFVIIARIQHIKDFDFDAIKFFLWNG